MHVYIREENTCIDLSGTSFMAQVIPAGGEFNGEVLKEPAYGINFITGNTQLWIRFATSERRDEFFRECVQLSLLSTELMKRASGGRNIVAPVDLRIKPVQ